MTRFWSFSRNRSFSLESQCHSATLDLTVSTARYTGEIEREPVTSYYKSFNNPLLSGFYPYAAALLPLPGATGTDKH